MKSRSPSKAPGSKDEEKLKIIIRIRPTLNEEDPQNFVNLEGVPLWLFRTTPWRSAGLATTRT